MSGVCCVARSDGEWLLFAFRNAGEDGAFVGGVTDPMIVEWQGGRLVQRATEGGGEHLTPIGPAPRGRVPVQPAVAGVLTPARRRG